MKPIQSQSAVINKRPVSVIFYNGNNKPIITNPDREMEIPDGLKEIILHPENTRDDVDFDPSKPSIHNDPISLSLLYAFDRNYSKEFEKDPELKEKYTIVIVTHNMQQAARISDRTAFFLMGELIEEDSTDKIFTQPVNSKTEDYITGRFG